MLAAACAAALIGVSTASAGGGAPARRSFVWPASGTITTPFGYGSSGFHPGLDIGMLRSLDVRAAAAGVVEHVGYVTGFEGYGQIVLVDLGSGVQTLYAHLSQVRARVGEHVVAGRLLGIAGCTGLCTGTHLHFEVRVDDKPVDPLPLLPATPPEAPAGPAQVRRLFVLRAARLVLSKLPSIDLTDWLAGPPSAMQVASPAVPQLADSGGALAAPLVPVAHRQLP